MPVNTWKVESLVNTNTAGVQTESSVAALHDGGYVVTWTTYESNPALGGDGSGSAIKMQRFDAAGQKVGGEMLVNDPAFAAAETNPDVTVLADGSFVVAWGDMPFAAGEPNGVTWKKYNADGSESGIDGWIPVQNQAVQTPEVVARADGGFNILVNSQQESGIRSYSIWRFDEDGNTGLVNITSANSTTFIDEYATTILTNGYEVTAYDNDSNGRIVARILKSGNALADIIVSTQAFTASGEPAIAGLTGGGFVVTWTDASQSLGDTFDTAIHGRIFDGEGNALTPEFRVSDLVTGYQQDSEVIALRDGGFAVVYQGFDNIRCSVFNELGQRVGPEFNVNVDPATQSMPSVAELADGRLAFTWSDNYVYGLDSSGGVHTKIMDPRDGSISGTDNSETIYGSNNAMNDSIHGEGGNDTIFGLAGNDTIDGGAGSDAIHGGDGFDFASYLSASAGVRAQLNTQAANTGDAAGDSYSSVEGLIGSNFDDFLVGDGNANELRGGAGDDFLNGLAGNDTLIGGAGTDTLFGGAGADVLDGGADIDFASYSDALTGVNAQLNTNVNNTGDAAGDTYISIEGLIGSAANDRLVGNAFDNVIRSGGGNDVVAGLEGADVYTLGAGNDRVVITSAAHSAAGVGNRDQITDWEDYGDDDTIDLSGFAGTLSFIGADAFTAANQVRAVQVGANVVVQVNTVGVGIAEAEIFLANTNIAQVDAGDFIL